MTNYDAVLEAVKKADWCQWEIGDALVAGNATVTDALLEAVKKADACKWAIGDALIAETGTRSNPKRYGEQHPGDATFEQWLALRYEDAMGCFPGHRILLGDVAKELSKCGVEVTESQLRRYRDCAEAFPPASRDPNVPWGVCWKTFRLPRQQPVLGRGPLRR